MLKGLNGAAKPGVGINRAACLRVDAREVVFGDVTVLETVLFEKAMAGFDAEQYRDQRIVLKGCGDTEVPVSAYVELTKKLTPIVKSLMFGEPCSTVPIYKRKD